MYDLKVSLTEEQRRRAEEKAHELGYTSPDEYLHDVIVDALDDGEVTLDEAMDALRSGIREAHRGGGMSVEEFKRRMAEDD
jgi:hypothetical protein